MNIPDRSASGRIVANLSLTGLLLSLAVVIGACRNSTPAQGTSVTLSNGETAGIIVTVGPDDPSEQTDGSFAPPAATESAAASGDDVIAAPTTPKAGAIYAFRYQNILITPGTDAASALGSISEDCEIADTVETDKKGTEITVRSYTFTNFVIYAKLNSEGKYTITRIILSNRNSVTPEGIGIGSSAEDVLKTYGTKYTDNGNSITYSSGTTDLTFFFANGEVSDITYSYNKLA